MVVGGGGGGQRMFAHSVPASVVLHFLLGAASFGHVPLVYGSSVQECRYTSYLRKVPETVSLPPLPLQCCGIPTALSG